MKRIVFFIGFVFLVIHLNAQVRGGAWVVHMDERSGSVAFANTREEIDSVYSEFHLMRPVMELPRSIFEATIDPIILQENTTNAKFIGVFSLLYQIAIVEGEFVDASSWSVEIFEREGDRWYIVAYNLYD